MIKEIAWNTFKNTGNINTFLELKQIPEIVKAQELTNISLQTKLEEKKWE